MRDKVLIKRTTGTGFSTDNLLHINKKGTMLFVNEAGFDSIIPGRLDFEFSKFSGRKLAKSYTISDSQKTGV